MEVLATICAADFASRAPIAGSTGGGVVDCAAGDDRRRNRRRRRFRSNLHRGWCG